MLLDTVGTQEIFVEGSNFKMVIVKCGARSIGLTKLQLDLNHNKTMKYQNWKSGTGIYEVWYSIPHPDTRDGCFSFPTQGASE